MMSSHKKLALATELFDHDCPTEDERGSIKQVSMLSNILLAEVFLVPTTEAAVGCGAALVDAQKRYVIAQYSRSTVASRKESRSNSALANCGMTATSSRSSNASFGISGCKDIGHSEIPHFKMAVKMINTIKMADQSDGNTRFASYVNA